MCCQRSIHFHPVLVGFSEVVDSFLKQNKSGFITYKDRSVIFLIIRYSFTYILISSPFLEPTLEYRVHETKDESEALSMVLKQL